MNVGEGNRLWTPLPSRHAPRSRGCEGTGLETEMDERVLNEGPKSIDRCLYETDRGRRETQMHKGGGLGKTEPG